MAIKVAKEKPNRKTPKGGNRKKKPVQEKQKIGRPTDYLPEYAQTVKGLCLLGLKDKQIADCFGIAESTLNEWKLKYPEFKESMFEGKIVADANVAITLYEIATDPKHFQSVQAINMWLKNRQPELWNAANKQEHTGKDGKPLMPQILVMSAADKKRLEEI